MAEALDMDGLAGDDFAHDSSGFDAAFALENVVVDALDADDDEQFIGGLVGGLGSLGRIAGGLGSVGRAAGRLGSVGRIAGRLGGGGRIARRLGGGARIAQQIGRRAGRVAQRGGRVRARGGGLTGLARRLGQDPRRLRRLARSLRSGAAEDQDERHERQDEQERRRPPRPDPRQRRMLGRLGQALLRYDADALDAQEAFEDLVDRFELDEVDVALPVIAGFAVRSLVRPLLRQAGGYLARPLRQQLVRSATRAARTLTDGRGPQAVRALPAIARGAAQAITRRPSLPASTAVRIATQSLEGAAGRAADYPRGSGSTPT